MERLMVGTKDASEAIGVSQGTLRKWRCRGKGPRWFRIGNTRYSRIAYRVNELRLWLAQQEEGR